MRNVDAIADGGASSCDAPEMSVALCAKVGIVPTNTSAQADVCPKTKETWQASRRWRSPSIIFSCGHHAKIIERLRGNVNGSEVSREGCRLVG